MYKTNRFLAMVIAALLVISTAASAQVNKQSDSKTARRDESFNPVEFIKQFKIGMSYNEVQELLPKDFDQDILSYITTDEVFMLSVDVPGQAGWNISFKFDTLDAPMRRPEQLIEMSCSAALTSRSESFDSIVQKVTAAFGEPIKVERTEDKFKQAGWRVGSGSVLTLEYSLEPNGGNTVSVEFTIKKNPRRDSTGFKAVA
ncbi:MAG TPA: hypothetical protein VNN73_21800 [Blastocatellia bacterium]|nr:hypothetical protein [Blastocatellia bacterium]